MMNGPTIFISYSQSRTRLKDHFVALLGDWGFSCSVFDYGTPGSVIETQKRLIEECDGFIAIITADQETADGRHLGSLTVNQEIGMAFQAEKPIQIFAESNVDIESLPIHSAGTVAIFDTIEHVADTGIIMDGASIRSITRAIIELSRRIESVGAYVGDDAFINYRSIKSRTTIRSRNDLSIQTEVAAVPLRSLPVHHHGDELRYFPPLRDGLILGEDRLRFRVEKPVGTRAERVIEQSTSESFAFRVELSPAVPPGSEFKYAYRRDHNNFIPYTVEELNVVLKDGTIRNSYMYANGFVGTDWFVTQPTDVLELKLCFHPGYPIYDYKPLACEYVGDQVHAAETARIDDAITFEFDEFDKVAQITMRVEAPRTNVRYLLLYRPPSEAELDSST